jgi:hypothetical protein
MLKFGMSLNIHLSTAKDLPTLPGKLTLHQKFTQLCWRQMTIPMSCWEPMGTDVGTSSIHWLVNQSIHKSSFSFSILRHGTQGLLGPKEME